MAFLFSFFTVVLSLCVVGLIVLALSSILGSVRDDWKLKKPKREPRRRALSLVNSVADVPPNPPRLILREIRFKTLRYRAKAAPAGRQDDRRSQRDVSNMR